MSTTLQTFGQSVDSVRLLVEVTANVALSLVSPVVQRLV